MKEIKNTWNDLSKQKFFNFFYIKCFLFDPLEAFTILILSVPIVRI